MSFICCFFYPSSSIPRPSMYRIVTYITFGWNRCTSCTVTDPGGSRKKDASQPKHMAKPWISVGQEVNRRGLRRAPGFVGLRGFNIFSSTIYIWLKPSASSFISTYRKSKWIGVQKQGNYRLWPRSAKGVVVRGIPMIHTTSSEIRTFPISTLSHVLGQKIWQDSRPNLSSASESKPKPCSGLSSRRCLLLVQQIHLKISQILPSTSALFSNMWEKLRYNQSKSRIWIQAATGCKLWILPNKLLRRTER